MSRLQTEPGAKLVKTKDWGWDNYIYRSKGFRHAHIERYFQDSLTVLHVTVFPHINNIAPIFGFDVVVQPKANKIAAAFLDYSPTNGDIEWEPNPQFSVQYPLPEWTTGIFSKQVVACRPLPEEYDLLFDTAYLLFDSLLDDLSKDEYVTQDDDLLSEIKLRHTLYCTQQQKNIKTFAALKAKLGADRAHYFMKTILFPKP